MTTPTTGAAELPEALRTVTRYEVVDCIDSKHVPAVIPNKDGPWVRYEDHLAALVEAQQPAPSAAAAPEGGPPGSGGWEKHAIEMERQRDFYRQRCHTMEEHQNGGVWYWQGDDGDNLESMGNSMLVVIRADQLRALIAAPQPYPTPQADSQPAPVAAFEVADAIADSQYLAGVSAGWNAANADNPNEALRKLHESRAGYLKPLSAARAPADSVTAPASGVVVQPSCPGIPRPGCNYLAQCESVCNKCGKLHSTRFLEDSQPVAAARRWSTYEQAIADPIFQTARSIMGTENIGQDRQLVKAINHVIDSTPPAQAADSVLEDAALLKARHDFLLWNRSLQPSPIESSVEYSVFDKALELYDAARKQGANQ